MLPGQSKVELYAALRRDAREGMSNRALERKYRVGWRTVQKALSSAWPQPREPYAPRRSRLDPFKPVIDEMLLADLDAPRKQRHTVVRIYRRLINEHAMDDVSYQVVRAYVAKRKPEIRVEAGRGPAQVFIEQSHLAGAEAEVDFGEVAVRLRGELVGGTPLRAGLFLPESGAQPLCYGVRPSSDRVVEATFRNRTNDWWTASSASSAARS